MNDRALTVREVADRLAVSEPSVRRMIARGDLHAITIGLRAVRVLESEVDRYLRSARHTDGLE